MTGRKPNRLVVIDTGVNEGCIGVHGVGAVALPEDRDDGTPDGIAIIAYADRVVHPAAAIDPESRRDVEAFRDLFAAAYDELSNGVLLSTAPLGVVANALQVAFRRWAEPAMPEPGLWAVVEASAHGEGATTARWVHYPAGWQSEHGGMLPWGRLRDAVLVREGVES